MRARSAALRRSQGVIQLASMPSKGRCGKYSSDLRPDSFVPYRYLRTMGKYGSCHIGFFISCFLRLNLFGPHDSRHVMAFVKMQRAWEEHRPGSLRSSQDFRYTCLVEAGECGQYQQFRDDA